MSISCIGKLYGMKTNKNEWGMGRRQWYWKGGSSRRQAKKRRWKRSRAAMQKKRKVKEKFSRYNIIHHHRGFKAQGGGRTEGLRKQALSHYSHRDECKRGSY